MEGIFFYRSMVVGKQHFSLIDREINFFHSLPSNSVHRCEMGSTINSVATRPKPVNCDQSETSILVSDWLQLTGFDRAAVELTSINVT